MTSRSIVFDFYELSSGAKSTIKKVSIAFGFALLTAIGAQIKIQLPFTPVPMTLQTLVVLSSGIYLGAEFGLLSQIIYIAFGLIGLPIFSGGESGLAVLFGVRGGYLFGFLLFSYLSGKLFYETKLGEKNTFMQWSAFYILSLLTIFVPGVLGLKFTLGVSIERALELGLYPFILGDCVKLFLSLRGTKLFLR